MSAYATAGVLLLVVSGFAGCMGAFAACFHQRGQSLFFLTASFLCAGFGARLVALA